MNESVSLLDAFVAGLQSFISPGFLPLIPGWLACVTGLAIGLPAANGERRPAASAAAIALAWSAGFSAVFITLAATASTLSQVLLERLPLFERIGGVVLGAVGLALIGAARPALLLARAGAVVAAGAAGAALAFGWTPRLGPVLDTLFMLSAAPQTLGRGLAGLLAHAAGLALPCIAAPLALSAALSATGVRPRAIGIVSGACLVLSGLLLWMTLFPRLAEWLAPSIPAA
jgi:cytochrome c-type biogenesis protein